MGTSLIKGTILGAVILYVWMTLSWMVLPWHCSTFEKFMQEDQVAQAITNNTTTSGIYVLPMMCGSEISKEQHDKATLKGPLVFAAVRRDGFNFASPRPYLTAFFIQLIGAFLVTYLFLERRESNYWKNVGFFTIFGVAVGILASFPSWNWWGFSLSYTVVECLDFIIGWFLVGLALSAVLKQKAKI